MERLTLTVSSAQAGCTIKSLLQRELAMADGLISSAKFRPNGILKNGCRARVTEHVAEGDRLSICIADRGANDASPLDLPLSVLWEDEALAVLDKPAGVSVYGEGAPNIAGILAYKWGANIEFHPVNRLDVGTTGLMVAAKDGYTHDRLRRLLHTDDFQRDYLAVAEGRMLSQHGVIELPISRAANEDGRRSIDPNGLPSRTEYAALETSDGYTLLRLRLYTGRTHQIRVQLAHAGWPLLGDGKYGREQTNRLYREKDGQALYSWKIGFVFPTDAGLLNYLRGKEFAVDRQEISFVKKYFG